MDRKTFLRRLGLGAVVALTAPAIVIGAKKGLGTPGWPPQKTYGSIVGMNMVNGEKYFIRQYPMTVDEAFEGCDKEIQKYVLDWKRKERF